MILKKISHLLRDFHSIKKKFTQFSREFGTILKGHPVHGKDTRHIQFSLCSHKRPTNFGSRWMVCEPFADGAAQVCSPIHTYRNLVRKPFASGLRTIRRARVYEALYFGLTFVYDCRQMSEYRPITLPTSLWMHFFRKHYSCCSYMSIYLI